MQIRRSCFQQLPWLAETVNQKNPPKRRGQIMEPTHPQGQVENATAPLRLCARFSGSGWESGDHFRTTSIWESGSVSVSESGSMECTIRPGTFTFKTFSSDLPPPASPTNHGPVRTGHRLDMCLIFPYVSPLSRLAAVVGGRGWRGAVVPDIEPSKQDLPIG